MRLTVEIADDGSQITVRADRIPPAMPPGRLSTGLAALAESALRLLVLHDPDDPDGAGEAGDGERDEHGHGDRCARCDTPTPPDRLTAVRRWCESCEADPGALRAAVLAMLDDGATEQQVCQRLDVSATIVRRWDDAAVDARLDRHAEAVGLR